MSLYCGRSPCDSLLPALGRYVFGDPKSGEYKLLVSGTNRKRQAVSIVYCPFCGTRLGDLELAATGKVIII
tara:strand:- start:93 stop:305 length:213 start_codon:yes stop_codon:yes gene_type:complete